MEKRITPPMTADKAHWTAIATALTSVVLALSGVTDFDIDSLSQDTTKAFSLVAAMAVQAAVAWVTVFYKRNYLK